MKVYVVECLWATDGEDTACYGTGVDNVYAKKEDAIKRMKDAIVGQKNLLNITEENGWEITEDETSWSACESERFSQEHISVFVEEREVL